MTAANDAVIHDLRVWLFKVAKRLVESEDEATLADLSEPQRHDAATSSEAASPESDA